MLRTGLRSFRKGQFCCESSSLPLLGEGFKGSFVSRSKSEEREEQDTCLTAPSLALRLFSRSYNGSHINGPPHDLSFQRGWRGLQTTSGSGPSDGKENGKANKLVGEMNSILQKIDAAHFTEVLQHEALSRWNMSEEEFTSLCMECGAANSSREALEICDALDKSGVVLRIKNLVYLRPLEVAEILFQALPDTAHEVRARLDQLKQEAAPLLEKKAKVDAHAHRYAKTWLWVGFAAFTLQMIVYARLTFWELSWDVMEPITYFTSATFAILAYIYCMWHNEEFGVLSARRRLSANMQSKKYAEKGLDTSKLDFLLHRINRLEATVSPVNLRKTEKDSDKPNGGGSIADPIGLQPVGQGVVT